ncbi:GntR family transcriptional regulator [Mumia quercus]|uniref:GntR family transcriptional regulator n=1 Tax=Mumia quercus TaxID=2976125 RepID=UPI0021D08DB9|nr:GntR family transcriptional regulator [Mumia quercus]
MSGLAHFRPLREEVRDELRSRITSGTYAPGTRLVERTIASELGVSRVPVREALQALVLEGFAEDRLTRGIAVRSYDAAQIADLAQVGGALEAVLVRRLATYARPSDLAPLRDVLDEAAFVIGAGDVPAAVAANARFHEVLQELGRGTIVGEVLTTIGERRRWLMRQHTDPAPIHAEHEALYAALVAADVEGAVALVEAHARGSVVHAVTSQPGARR